MWLRQPQFPAPLDHSNPLARGIQFCFDGRTRCDAVSGRLLTPVKPSFTAYGVATSVTGTTDVPQLPGRTFKSGSGLTMFVLLKHGTHDGNYRSVIGRGTFGLDTGTAIEFLTDGNWELFCSSPGGEIGPLGAVQSSGIHSYGCVSTGSGATGYTDGRASGTVGSPTFYIDTSANTWLVGASTTDLLTEYMPGDYLFAAAWNRPLAAHEMAQLHANPWRIFIAPRVKVVLDGGTVQYARPSSDVTAGTWTASTGSDLYAMLDETVASDSDYIVTTGASTCEVALGSLSDPSVSTGHKVRYRLSATSGGITVKLRQGTTTIATWTHAPAPTSMTTYEQTLTGGEADSITNYAALKLQFEATA